MSIRVVLAIDVACGASEAVALLGDEMRNSYRMFRKIGGIGEKTSKALLCNLPEPGYMNGHGIAAPVLLCKLQFGQD